GVGIKRRKKSPLVARHFAVEPSEGFSCALGKQRIFAALPGQRQQLEQLGVVVEHFFEMWDEPTLVHGISRETSAQMVVNSPLAHASERVLDGFEKPRIICAQ